MHQYQPVTAFIGKTKRHLNNSHRRTEEYIMKPGPQGWFKRPCLRVSMGNNEHIEDFPAEVATGLLRAHAIFKTNQTQQKKISESREIPGISQTKIGTTARCFDHEVHTKLGKVNTREKELQNILSTPMPETMNIADPHNTSHRPSSKTRATGLLQALHDHQYRNNFHEPSYIHADGKALTLFRIVLRTVKEWITEHEDQIKPHTVQKLLFAHSDILRDASARMRMAQAMEAQNQNVFTTPTRATQSD